MGRVSIHRRFSVIRSLTASGWSEKAQDDIRDEIQGPEVFDGHWQALQAVAAWKVPGIGFPEADGVFLKPPHVEVVHSQ